MKMKLLSILGVLSVLSAVLVAVGVSSSSASTQTKTFETSSEGMVSWYGASVSRVSTPPAHTGTYSLRVSPSGQWWGVEERWPGKATVSPGMTYRVGGYLKKISGATSVQLSVVWVSTSGGYLREDTVGSLAAAPVDWSEAFRDLTAPATARTVLYRLTGVGRGVFQVDDLSLGARGPVPTTTTSPTGPTIIPTTTTPPRPTTTTTVPPTSTTTTVPPTTTTTSPPNNGCTNPEVIQEQDGRTFDAPGAAQWYVHNDAWNWQGPNSGQRELMYVCNYNSWRVDSWGFDTPQGEVFMYPSTKLDVTGSCCDGLPISNWPNQIMARWAYTVSGYDSGSSYNVAFDLWLNGVADGDYTELMIWEQNRNADPAGSLRAPYTAPGGRVYDVYWDGNRTGDGEGSYLAFINRTPDTSGTTDLRAFIQESINRGYLGPNPTANQLNFGLEVRDTGGATQANPGRFTLTDYDLIMN